MARGLGLAFTLAFVAAIAAVWTKFPASFALPYLGGVAGFIILWPVAVRRLQRGQLEADRMLRDTEPLHKPNELAASVFLTYAQWILLGLAVLGIGKGLLPVRVDSSAYMF